MGDLVHHLGKLQHSPGFVECSIPQNLIQLFLLGILAGPLTDPHGLSLAAPKCQRSQTYSTEVKANS